MIDIFYIIIITILLLFIFSLMRKIGHLKKQHQIKIAKLHQTLSNLIENEEKNSQKSLLENNINAVISDAKRKLNEDIFDLQLDVFRKLTKN